MKVTPDDMSDFLYERKKEDALILRFAEEIDLDIFLDELKKQEQAEQENDENWLEYLATEQAKGDQDIKRSLNVCRITIDAILEALKGSQKETP